MGNWLDRDLAGDTTGHDNVTWLWIAASARAALARPVSWTGVVAAIAGSVAWSPDALLLAPLTFFVAFVRVLWEGRTQSAAIALARKRPARLPSADAFTNPEVRGVIERLGRARAAIQGAVSAGPHGAAFDVDGPLAPVADIERDVLVLAARVEYLAKFLSSRPATEVRTKPSRSETPPVADEQPSDATHVETRRRPIPSCREHLEKLAALEGRGTALLDEADRLLRTLEQVPAAITSLQLDRLIACDTHPVGDIEKAAGVIRSLEALTGAALGRR